VYAVCLLFIGTPCAAHDADMTGATSDTTMLRFVGADRGQTATSMRADHGALTATDARWVFAARVGESLEGHSAAVLPPEKRERLMRLAEVIGLRAFDANLIIAIVQDSVRCGLEPLSRSTADRLAMVAGAGSTTRRAGGWSRAMVVAWAAMLGAMGATALIRWVGG
jgi:hypothetical protein